MHPFPAECSHAGTDCGGFICPWPIRNLSQAVAQIRNAFRNTEMLLGTAVSGFSFPSISKET